jgi:RNA polymerase sigma factor (sigma-70 family)
MDSLPSSAMPDIDDAELVARSRAGDTEAFAQIVARYQALICALTFSATGRQSQSEDLAQETFVVAWKKLGELREPEKLRAWLCGIARNLCLNLHRDNQREPIYYAEPLESANEETIDASDPAALAMRSDEEAIVWRALEQMPEIYREPLVLYYRQHQSIEHVAVELDLSEEVVRQRLSRGRKMLNEQVAAMVEGTLARTGPGQAFTNNVMVALPPLGLATAKITTSTAAGATATAAKSLAAAKGTSAFSLLVTMFWPTTAIIAAFRLAVQSGGLSSSKEQTKISKPSLGRVFFEFAMIGAMLGTVIHYKPAHPRFVVGGMVGFFIIYFTVIAWHNPQQAKIWFRPWLWNGKAVWQFIGGTLLWLAEGAAVCFVTIHYPHATLIVLGLTCAGLFVTFGLLGLRKLKRWDWWRLALKITGEVTTWVMISTFIDDYWSAHPIEFLGTALWLFLGFTIARLAADKWEAQTSPDPEKLRQWEEKGQEGKHLLLKRQKAKAAVAADFKDLTKSQWAMTKKPRIATIALLIIFMVALPKQGDAYFNSNPAFFTGTAYGMIGLMSLSCMLTFFFWRTWRQHYLEKIQTVRTGNDWMEVIEHLPMLANIAMLLIALRIFFNLDAPSVPLTVSVIVLGAGCGVLARGFGIMGKQT